MTSFPVSPCAVIIVLLLEVKAAKILQRAFLSKKSLQNNLNLARYIPANIYIIHTSSRANFRSIPKGSSTEKTQDNSSQIVGAWEISAKSLIHIKQTSNLVSARITPAQNQNCSPVDLLLGVISILQ